MFFGSPFEATEKKEKGRVFLVPVSVFLWSGGGSTSWCGCVYLCVPFKPTEKGGNLSKKDGFPFLGVVFVEEPPSKGVLKRHKLVLVSMEATSFVSTLVEIQWPGVRLRERVRLVKGNLFGKPKEAFLGHHRKPEANFGPKC